MLNQESLTLVQLLLVTGLGLSVLAISIKVFICFTARFSKDGAAAAPVIVAEDSSAEQDFAMILAVMNEELNHGNGAYRIKSIREAEV